MHAVRLWRSPPMRCLATVIAAVAAVTASLVTISGDGTATAQTTGSTLLTETFEGSSVVDPNWIGLNAACLTGATQSPPTGQSNLGPCSHTAGSPSVGVTPGYLQLTDASLDQAGAVLYNQALPASGGIQITFQQYQYGGTGADGIGFFIVDGSYTPTSAGAEGGALGYAQCITASGCSSTQLPGVTGGYLGVGLDAFGNYSNDNEGRGNGCTTLPPGGLNPEAVGLRGPGSGFEGYCWLTGNLKLPANLRNSTGPAAALRTVQITVTPQAYVTVNIDFNNGAGYQSVLSYQMPDPLPTTFKFGLAASTGGSTDVHLIRGVTVSSVVTLPSLNLEKVVDETTPQPSAYAVGDTVPYDFVVTNTSPDTVSDVAVTDPNVTDVTCPSTTLAPAGSSGSSMTCTGSYTITLADAVAGDTFTNTATVTGEADGATATDTASATVNLVQTTGISLTKTGTVEGASSSPGTAHLGDTVQYTYTVTNTGDSALTNVQVTDSKVGTLACGSGALAPGASATCTATYTVAQADMDAGSVTNSATATATSPDGEISSQPASFSIPTASSPAAPVLTKSATLTGTASDQPVAAGDVVDYTFTVTNPGNVTLDNITINDALSGISGIVCDSTVLGPGQSTTCEGTYTLAQADIDRGSLTNSATATGYTPSDYAPNPNEPLTSNTATATLPLPPQPSLTLVKTAAVTATGANGNVVAGDTIDYTYTVTNTGNVTVSDIDVSDNLAGLSPIACATSQLAPQASTTCTAVYTVTQADIDTGSVSDTATATGKDPEGNDVPPASGSNTEDVPRSASLSLVKTASISPNTAGLDAAGAVITYTYTLQNTGTVTLSSISVKDSRVATSAISCPTTSLAPGATTMCTATYTVTEANVDKGRVVNTAVASASSPLGTVTSNRARAKVALQQVASIVLTKVGVATPTGPFDDVLAGDSIGYAYNVTNTGTVTVHALRVFDSLLGSAAISCPSRPIEPGASETCTATYTITQDDIDAGSVVNTATASALGPEEAIVVSNLASYQVPIVQVPLLTLTKTATTIDANGAYVVSPGVGDIIHYTYGVSNDGNVPITNVGVVDALPGLVPSPPACALTTLAPSESTTCTADYTITQSDVNAGSITNVAVATGQGPNGGDLTSPQAEATVALNSDPLLTLTKIGELDRTNDSVPAAAGDTITYTYTLTDSGTVTLTPTSVDDNVLGPIDCSGPPLAPGQSATCTATYVLTQADIDAGVEVNTATATASTIGNTPVSSPPDSEIIPLTAAPGLVLTKTAEPNGLNAGDTMDYEYTVTNTGNVVVSGLSVSDDHVSSGGVHCPVTTLTPTASTICTATYTITQADVDAGHVTNTATASGTEPDGSPVDSPPASATVPIPKPPPPPPPPTTTTTTTPTTPTTSTPTSTTTTSTTTTTTTPPSAAVPRLAVYKSGVLHTAGAHPKPGDTIEYSYLVENTGNVAISGITVKDRLPGLSAVVCPVTVLARGASTTCHATYALTQADIDAGHVANTAVATGTPSTGGSTTSPPSSADVPVPRFQEMSLVKTAVPAQNPAVAGTKVTYNYAVSNTGNTTIKDITVNDVRPGLSAVSCPATTLAPGATMTCSATYVVTQADIDTGSLVNVATATGKGSDGSSVVSPESSSAVPLDQASSLSLAKSGALSKGPVAAGSIVYYSFTVQNTGVVTVHSLTITDDQPGLSAIACPKRFLGPGQSVVCTGEYIVSQDDVNHGSVSDNAVATAETPNGTGVTSPIAGTTVALSQDPHLSLQKVPTPLEASSLAAPIAAGGAAHYSYIVTNAGNVTVSGLSISDDHIATSAITCPETELQPGQSMACTASYVLTQTDVNRGAVTNTAAVHGVEPDGTTVTSPVASATVKIPEVDRLSLVKEGALATTPAKVGTVITWKYVVTDTGTTTEGHVSVLDHMDGLSPVSCPTTTLAPGASMTCTATSTVTPADVLTGWLINDATATGVTPTGVPVTSPLASVIVQTGVVAAPEAPVTTTTTTTPPTTTPPTTAPPTTAPTTPTTSPATAPPTTTPPTTPRSSGPPLAFTGAEIAGTSLLGAVLIAGGTGLALAGRRRRDRRSPGRHSPGRHSPGGQSGPVPQGDNR